MTNPFKGDLTFLDALSEVCRKYHGDNFHWSFGDSFGNQSYEIILIIDGDIDEAE